MIFTPINMKNWYRIQTFSYFSQMAPTTYSLTVNVDITDLRQLLKSRGMKFYPVYLWLVTKYLNEQTEFKIAKKDGQIGYYDTLTPFYAVFHEDDHSFSMIWQEYTADFRAFYAGYLENQQKYGRNHGFLGRPELPPPNAYTVSCMPWVSFSHFSVHSNNPDYYFPSVEAGKFFEEEDRVLLPLSLTCHHATTDGYHIKTFLEAFQDGMEGVERFL
jgi:chloramphenicol O-acetyltransferase type A